MNRRKSIAISDVAYELVLNHCSGNIAPFINETIIKSAINSELANTPQHVYASKKKRKLVQISIDAWKHLKKLEYSFIFEADNDRIPLNDIASIAIITTLLSDNNKSYKTEIKRETAV